ncbi:Ig-like domain repeat protein [Nocardioides litoris]|uniref:Ig-like domain repeat protein n=1 Tax=Nocardioides litoris TaxID=1926648 RepID=UPI001120996E|nr:Ig-like domain repeat protein [Nocardioides litoris]
MSPALLLSTPTLSRGRRLVAGVLAVALGAGASAAAAAPSYAGEPTAAVGQRAAAGSVIEAEDGVLTGVTRQTEHAGYTGTGFVGGFGATGQGVAVTAAVPAAGTYDLFVRYANGGPNRTLTLTVNGAPRQVTLPGSGAWNSYGVVWASVDLAAGANTLDLTRTAADSGQLNVDSFRVAPRVGTRYEAEDAALSGGAALASDHAGFTGTGFVGGIQAAGATAAFTVTATEAGNHPATLRYGAGPNPFNGPKRVTIDVNGAQQSVFLPGFSSWKTWGDYALDLPLVAGTNQVSVRYQPGDDGNVNLDHLDVGQPAPPVCDNVVEPDDTFAGTSLDRCRWTTVLNDDPAARRVADGVLAIDALPGDLSGGVTNARNVVLQPAPAGGRWMAETDVSLDGTDDYLQGGLVLWGNAANFGKVTVIRTPADGWKVELGRVTAGTLAYTGSATLPAGAQTDVRLRLWVADGRLRAAYSLDQGTSWTVVGAGYAVDGISDPLVGVAAFNGTGGETARFGSFALGEPVLVAPAVDVTPASAATGQTTTVTVAVTGPGATPTGEVTLRDGSDVVGTAALADGATTFTVGPYAAAGERTLTASYAGDTAFAAASGTGALTVTAAPVASTTTVVADPGSIETGRTSTVRVTVAAAGSTPTGEVTLRDGDQVVGSSSLSGGVATFQVGPYATVGTRTLTATYAGSGAVTGSTGTGSLVVTPAPVASTTTVAASPGSVRTGQASTVTVTVSAQGTTPAGEVTLRDGDQLVGTAPLTAGTATFQVGPYAAAGTRTLTATYAGSGSVTGSTGSGTLTVTPAPLASTTTVTVDPGSVTVGQGATLAITVAAPGTTPGGRVTVREGERELGTVDLVDGAATLEVGVSTAEGTRTFTATYLGSATVDGSSGTVVLTVTPAPVAPVASTVAVAGPASVETGRTASMRVTVTADGATPSGRVDLTDGVTTWAGDLVDGTAVVPVGPWATAGTRTLTASYAGDARVLAGTGSTTLAVRAVVVPPAPKPAVRVVGGKVDAAAKRRTGTVRMACTPAGAVCRGTVVLRAGGTVLGRGTFAVAGGRTVAVRVTLNGRARRALAAQPRTRARLTVVMAGRGSVARVTLVR